jgi:micrococcal nuclease
MSENTEEDIPQEFKVREVIDGDTFRIEGNWERVGRKGNVIRPYGYDAPEKGKPGYLEAKQKLTDLILGKMIAVTKVRLLDKFGRLVAHVEYDRKNLSDYFPEFHRKKN